MIGAMPDPVVMMALLTVASWLALAVVCAVAVVRRYRQLPVPGWLVRLGALLAGLGVSVTFIVAISEPFVLASSLVLPAILAVALLRYGRFATAGILLVGLCLPGAAWWGRFLVADALDPVVTYDRSLWLWWLPEMVGLLVAIGLMVIGDVRTAVPMVAKPRELARDPLIIANGISGAIRLGPFDLPNVVSVGLGAALVIVGLPLMLGRGMPWPVALAVAAVAYALASTFLFYPAIPRRVRAAWEGFAAVGHPEMDRWRQVTGTEVPNSLPRIRRWLREHAERADALWAHAELLAVTGDLAAARDATQRMLVRDAADQHEQASLLAYIDWIEGRDPDITTLAAEAEGVGDPGSLQRQLARGRVAVMRARMAAAQGGDWMAPLVAHREAVGPVARRWFLADTLAKRFRATLVIGLALAALVLLGSGGLR